MKIFKRCLNDIETQLKVNNIIYVLLHFGWFFTPIFLILTRIKSFSASSSLEEKTENKLQSYNFWNFLLVNVSFNKETVAENRFWRKFLAFLKKPQYQRLSVVKQKRFWSAGAASGDAAGYCRRSGDQGIGIQEILVGEFHVRGYKTQLTFA